MALNALSGAQQRQWHQLRLHFRHAVQEPALGHRAHGLGFIKGRAPPHRCARRDQGLQRPLDVLLPVSLVRPQGEIGGLGGASHRSLRRCQSAAHAGKEILRRLRNLVSPGAGEGLPGPMDKPTKKPSLDCARDKLASSPLPEAHKE